jgi:hypothetical protein
MWKCAIRDAIDAVNTISLLRNIFCSLVCINAETFDPIRDSRSDSRDIQQPSICQVLVRYFIRFKTSLAGLFSMSLWGKGEIITHSEIPPHKEYRFRHFFIKNLPANQHYLMILTTFSGQENAKEVSTLEPKETVFNETNAWQIPVQDTGQGPFLEELALPAFSRLIASMIRWSLIREGTDPDNDQETLQHHHGWRADIVRIFRPYEKRMSPELQISRDP